MNDGLEISGHDIVSFTDGSICPLPFLESRLACSNTLAWSFTHTIYIILILTAVLLSCKCASLQLMGADDVLFPVAPSIMTLLNLDSQYRDIKQDKVNGDIFMEAQQEHNDMWNHRHCVHAGLFFL